MNEARWTQSLSLNRDDSQPLYKQLEEQFEQMIRDGVFSPGDRLPGDQELSAFLGINNRTVRKGLAPLVERGMIRRTQRAGTFVTDQPTQRPAIGVFYFHEASAFMNRRTEYIQQMVQQHGFDVKIKAYARDYFHKVDLLEEVKRLGLHGLVLALIDDPACRTAAMQLEKAGFPIVRFGTSDFSDVLRSPLVRSDHTKATIDAMEFLWSVGHRNIGLTRGTHSEEVGQVYRDFFAKRGGHQKNWELVVDYDTTLESLYTLPVHEMVEAYLQDNPEVTAICTHVLTHELLDIAPLRGKAVPDDLSILSVGNLLPWSRPGVTVFRPSPKILSQTATQELLKQIASGPDLTGRVFDIPFSLVDGNTVASSPLENPLSANRKVPGPSTSNRVGS